MVTKPAAPPCLALPARNCEMSGATGGGERIELADDVSAAEFGDDPQGRARVFSS
ncbi:MAG: hypothetical protein QOG14_3632 [Mycobacterium sp.]|jgi:hypothetical protein|nr:hypothetical protein [Mycobacterium sp.]MDT5411412.1 hypothetical protein [Mycobacterium sp.]